MRRIYDQCGSQHLYSYTGNNPINYVDPTGHRRIEDEEPVELREQIWNRTVIWNSDTQSYEEYNYLLGSSIIADPESMTTLNSISRFLEYAIAEGMRSQTEYLNGASGDRVESGRDTDDTIYNREYGLGMVGEDWCGYLLMYCSKYTSGTWGDWASTGRLNTNSPQDLIATSINGYIPFCGDIFFYITEDAGGYAKKNTYSHIGVVIGSRPDEGIFFTVEGNVDGRIQFGVRSFAEVTDLKFLQNNMGLNLNLNSLLQGVMWNTDLRNANVD